MDPIGFHHEIRLYLKAFKVLRVCSQVDFLGSANQLQQLVRVNRLQYGTTSLVYFPIVKTTAFCQQLESFLTCHLDIELQKMLKCKKSNSYTLCNVYARQVVGIENVQVVIPSHANNV